MFVGVNGGGNYIFSFLDSCVDAYYNWIKNDSLHLKSQCEPWEMSIPQRRQAVKLAKSLIFKHGKKLETIQNKLNMILTYIAYLDESVKVYITDKDEMLISTL